MHQSIEQEICKDPHVLYLQLWNPVFSRRLLPYFLGEIEANKFDIVVVETAMSGLLSTVRSRNEPYTATEFTRRVSMMVPTFLLPDDTKAHERRSFLFYELPYVIGLDSAYSAIRDQVLFDMIDMWKRNDMTGFIEEVRQKYQLPQTRHLTDLNKW